jgi:hypothetical protein
MFFEIFVKFVSNVVGEPIYEEEKKNSTDAKYFPPRRQLSLLRNIE